MELRFYLDEETGQPHIYRHGVEVAKVAEVLNAPLEDGAGIEDTRVAVGQTEPGRFLRVIYVPGPEPDAVFVITAYALGPKALTALRRRLRRRR